MRLTVLIASALLAGAAIPASAEVSEIRIAEQYGVGFLPLMVMRGQGLIEKEAAERGLPDLKVSWTKLGVASAMADALISEQVDFISGGVPTMVLLWSRTKDNLRIKGVGGMSVQTSLLTTRNPNVRKLEDFTDKDRIAVVTVKTSSSAITLQMAAEKVFGEGNHEKLDPLTVSRSNPDAMIALLSPQSEITAHFGPAPFYTYELQDPNIHQVLSSDEVYGGPATNTVVTATGKFKDNNPKTFDAFVAALSDAIDIINSDKEAAAKFYLAESGDKLSLEDIMDIIKDDSFYEIGPRYVYPVADFMYRTGVIPHKPADWKELFFENIHDIDGH